MADRMTAFLQLACHPQPRDHQDQDRAAGVAALVIAALVVLNVLDSGKDSSRPGDPAVYSRIDSLTDCSALQSEFNAADARHGTQVRNHRTEQAEIERSYMEAADGRMRTIGCYE